MSVERGQTAIETKFVLASASSARRLILSRADIPFVADVAEIDEAPIKTALAGAEVGRVALALAEAKARAMAQRHSGALVAGADQILECDGRWFDKPPDRPAAERQLLALRGRCHRLVSAVVVVRDRERLWQHVDEAKLWMREFSDGYLAAYLDSSGPEVLESVGAYRLEGQGAQLFDRIEGDHFTILGLPLLPLLEFLRRHGILPT